MEAPDNDTTTRETVARPLSPALSVLDSPDPPLSRYNQPHYHPALYNIPVRYTSHHVRPIRPFRIFNYLDAQGEDLGSRQYTLGPDNIWEVNERLTNVYRHTAQNTSGHPQFTSVYVPKENEPQPVAPWWLAIGADGDNHLSIIPQLQPSPALDSPAMSEEVIMNIPVASISRETLDRRLARLPPSPITNQSRSSPGSPNTDPGPSTSPSRRRPTGRHRSSTLSSQSKSIWRCEPCDKTFFRRHELNRHINTASAHQERGFNCRYCGDAFTRADAKLRHEEDTCTKRWGRGGRGTGKKSKGGGEGGSR
ncbi:hypothetical protein CTheo_4338 [Ceratobasidium theobromae]|uniref:C2H2-type domain-containing protein n=1 Tax=Ceratobasidium theobromae TaxID=1582974 RepID=A0A5N5QL73_9AGAM|nr:hypothetical protein CTheo_4338 [Ceratobasidium theobromae]